MRSALRIAAPIVVTLLVIIFAVGYGLKLHYDRAASVPTPPPGLDRIVISHSGLEVAICPAEPLHGCWLRLGAREGYNLEMRGFSITPPRTCENQATHADEDCDAEGLSRMSGAFDECRVRHGIVPFAYMQHSDMRDAHLPHGALRLECREGIRDGYFNDPAF